MATKGKRIVCLVADGLGVGEAPDAARYGDQGSNTLGNLARAIGGIRLPNLEKIGLGHLGSFDGVAKVDRPTGLVTRLAERSEGKDTTTGHWELAGLVTRKPFPTFPNGFPAALVEAFVTQGQIPGVLGNLPASGTTILEELGEAHLATGKPILYTSADSVFQIAAHEKHFGLDRLYRLCELARKLCQEYQIGRVIARPFLGETAKTFKRTEHRRDYSMTPPENCLDLLQKAGIETISVGKIDDIFDHRGLTRGHHTGNNPDGLAATLDFMKKTRGEEAFIFTNLVDFDMLYGHRRDPKGYADCLSQMDAYLPKILAELAEGDVVMMTADHGCDPTFRGSDHTREYVPLVAYGPSLPGGRLPDRTSFADVAASVLGAYGVSAEALPDVGKTFFTTRS